MPSTPLISPQRAPSASGSATDAPHSAFPVESEPPTFGTVLEDIVPVVDVIAVAGPPVIFVAAPWLLLGLMLSGPFALVVALFLVAMGLLALTAAVLAILVGPYLLVRHLRARRAQQAVAVASAPAVRLVSADSPRVA